MLSGDETGSGDTSNDSEIQSALAHVNSSVYKALGNNPLKFIDPYGLDPWQPFPDADSAGKDAACYIKNHPLTQKGENVEQMADIYKDKGGTFYYYNTPQHGDSPYPSESHSSGRTRFPGDSLAGNIHNHLKGEDFSNKNNFPPDIPKDIEMYKKDKIPGYLLTPSGKIKKYDPTNDKTTTIGSCN